MKKLLSIFLTALMLISTVIISVGAINSDSTEPKSISMTVYDVETGEETVEEYQIDPEIIKALSSKAVATTTPTIMSSPSIPQYNLCLLSGDAEFTNIGLSRVSNSTLNPYSAIGLYKVKKELNITHGYGTAFMVSDNVAVTVAHNLYDKKNNKWFRSGDFYPGKNASGIGNEPYGWTYAKKWAVCTQYIENTDERYNSYYDWGAIVFDKPIGKKCGKLTLSPLSYDEIRNAELMTAGYPQYTSKSINLVNYCQYERKMSAAIIMPEFFTAPVYNLGGQSGSPVIANGVVCGIVSHKPEDEETQQTTYTRINETAYSYLMQFVAENA